MELDREISMDDKLIVKFITQQVAVAMAEKTKQYEWIKTYLDVLNKEERKFLLTKLRLNKEPWGLLYLLFKVHKIPLKTRPVVSY